MGGGRRGAAAAQAERTAGTVFLAARAGQLGFSALMIGNDARRFGRAAGQAGLLAAVTAESVWLWRRIARSGGHDERLALWVDTLASAAALVVSQRTRAAGAAPWAKNVAIGAAIGAAGARRRHDAVASVAVLCAAALQSGRAAGVNDAISWAGMSFAARRYLAAHRQYAVARDDAEVLAVERSAARAAQDERAAQHDTLHRATIDTLRAIAAAEDGTRVRALAAAEAARLRYALRSEGRLPQGFDAALDAIALDAAARGVHVELVTAELDHGPGIDVARAVAAVVQAAVRAAAEDGGATRVVVRAYNDDRLVRMTIRDHGAGFANGDEYGERLHALTGMLDAVGGTVTVWSAPGSGVRVELAVPSHTAVDAGQPEPPRDGRPRITPWGTGVHSDQLDPNEARQADRPLIAAVLAWRATGLATGVAAVAAGHRGYRSGPAAVRGLALALAESVWFGVRALRRGRWRDPVASAVDAITGVVVLLEARHSLAPVDRPTWRNWAPWSFATNVVCAQAMTDQPVRRPVAGAAAVVAAHAAHGPRAGDAIANVGAQVGFFVVARLFAAQLRTGAVRLHEAQADAVEQGRRLARAREVAASLRTLHDSAVQTLESIGAGRSGDLAALRLRAAAEAEALAGAVRPIALADLVARHADLQVDVVGDLPPLPAEIRDGLVAACGEALTNVAKHAQVARAEIRVSGDGTHVRLDVVDDGVGFVPAAAGGGFGMANSIVRRMSELGGDAEVSSAPGRGTRIVLRWPA